MADLDRRDPNQSDDGSYTAQSENVDSVNINNFDQNDYQPYLHDAQSQSNQTQETVVKDRSQLNNYNAADYSVVSEDAVSTNMDVTDGFVSEGVETNTYREETAAEIAAPVTFDRREERDRDAGEVREGGGAIGLSALALSILSLFVFPVLFGGAGIVLGFIARSRGSATGTWAVTIGAISLILGIFILPFF